MIQRVKALNQQYQAIPEDSPPKMAAAAGRAWVVSIWQKWKALPKGKQQKIVGFTCGGICVLGLFSLAMPEPGTRTANQPAASTQGGRRSPLTKSGYIGTWAESDLDLVVRATNANDTEAVASLMATDRAFWIPANRAIEVQSSGGFFGSRIKARFVGDTRYFYTVVEAAQ